MRPRLLAATVALACALPSASHAHDGAIDWRTIQTAHAEVHFPATHRAFAQRVADAFEQGWEALTPVFNYRPVTPVQVTIDDYIDVTNGFANPRPFDRIHVRAYPPRWLDDLAGHGDWVRLLVFHELAHLLHLGQHAGLSKLVNTVLGRTYLPNQYLPRMIIEGIAVWAESRKLGYDRGGRGRIDSPQYMMKLRAFIDDDRVPQLQELMGRPLRWPRGNGWYLFGSLLIDHQVRRHGEKKLMRFIDEYGRRPAPYAINALYKRIYGISALTMWADAVSELRARVRRERRLREHGITPRTSTSGVLEQAVPATAPAAELPDEGTRLTVDGETKGQLRLHPGGHHAVYVSVPNDALPRLVLLDLRSRQQRVLRICELGCREPVFGPGGERLWWSESRPWRRLYYFQDLFSAPIDVRAGRLGAVKRLTRGGRIRRVLAKSPKNGPGRRFGRWRIVPPADVSRGLDAQGRWALVDHGSFRDLVCNETPVLRAQRGIRSFSVHEASGVVAVISPRSNGDEVHLTRLPTDWRSRCGTGLAASAIPRRKPSPAVKQERPYRSLSTLRPRNWQPALAIDGGGDALKTIVGLSFAGRDALALHSYSATAQTDLEAERPLVTAAWNVHRFEPTWTLAATYAHSWTWFTRGYRLYWLRDRRVIGRVAGSWRYPRLLDGFDFSASYRLARTTIREPVDHLRRQLGGHDPFGPVPREPSSGNNGAVSWGAAWSRQERYANSITVERKWRYAAFMTVAAPWLLSDRPDLRLDLHTEHAWPLGGHRALQWRTRVGLGQVYDERAPTYAIVGLPQFDPEALLFGGAGQDFSVVRGFQQPVGENARRLQGHVLGWTSVQAHWPLLDLGRGLDTLPFYLGRAWLVTFMDLAAAVDLGEPKRKPPPGTGWVGSIGAELRADLEVGYIAQGALVLGYARAFGDVRSSQWYLRLAP